jgi:hypothetical protein
MRVAGLALLVLIALAAPLEAQPERGLAGALTIESDDPCLTRDALIEAIAMWLGRTSVPADLGITVGQAGGDVSARFVVHIAGAPAAERSFAVLPAACPDRRAALGLAIALAIDHAVLEGLGIVTPEPAKAVAPPSPPAPSKSVVLPRPAPRHVGLSFEAGVALLGAVLPHAAPAGRVAVELELGPLRVRAGALATLEQTFRVGSGRTDAALVAASLEACLARAFAHLAAGACLGSAAGQLRAEGSRDFAAAREARLPWAAASAGLFARLFPQRSYGLRADLLGLVPYVRPHLDELDTEGDVLKQRTFPAAGILAGMSFLLVLR